MTRMISDTMPEMADNLAAWHEFSAPLEGRVYSMYCDIRGLVTTGVGLLIDPMWSALQLPWRVHDPGTTPAPPDAKLATRKQIETAWRDIKANSGRLSKLHWKYAARRNTLRLSERDVDEIVKRKLFDFESYMAARHFPSWSDFPADAQLAICSMAWACGPGFPATFKNFTRFATKQDWPNAALCAKIREAGNPGIVPRNRHNQTCFANAATVIANGMDRDVLHWPEVAGVPTKQAPVAIPEPQQNIDAPELIPLEVPWEDMSGEMRADVLEADR